MPSDMSRAHAAHDRILYIPLATRSSRHRLGDWQHTHATLLTATFALPTVRGSPRREPRGWERTFDSYLAGRNFPKYLKRFCGNPIFRGVRKDAAGVRAALESPELQANLRKLAKQDRVLDVNGRRCLTTSATTRCRPLPLGGQCSGTWLHEIVRAGYKTTPRRERSFDATRCARLPRLSPHGTRIAAS
jgi:hypothetical protein